MQPQQKKRFKVGLSFPGEKRASAAQVATELAQQFGEPRILYDKYHSAELARPGLDAYLPKLYEILSNVVDEGLRNVPSGTVITPPSPVRSRP